MKRLFRIALVLILIGLLSAAAVYKFVYNKPHPDFENLSAKYSMNAEDLFYQYSLNTDHANHYYTGQMIEIEGLLTRVDKVDDLVIAIFVYEEGIFGDEGIRCTMLPEHNEPLLKLDFGTQVKIKGYCTGYNDTDVIMEKCTLEE